MAIQKLILFLLMLDVALSDNKKRLVLHSDLDISSALHDIRQELDATKQENLALRSQMEQLNQTLTTQMTQENVDLKAKLAQLNQTLTTKMAQEDVDMIVQVMNLNQTLTNQMAQENVDLKTQLAQLNQTLNAQMAREDQVLKDQMTLEKLALKAELAQLRSSQGSTYVRWGRTVCSGNGTQKVYSGFSAGSSWDTPGGAANFVCLPETPSWAYYVDGFQQAGRIYGTEYQTKFHSFDQHAFGKGMQDQDAPCVVCHTSRTANIMIPGSITCYSGWTQEYTGYLMSGDAESSKVATEYVCVDKDPEAVYHGEANDNGKLLFFTEAHCGSLPCQEYPQGRELACVVCSK